MTPEYASIIFALFVVGIGLGMHVERTSWQEKTMGDLCGDGYEWACRLHPQCEMNALVCFHNPEQ